MGQIFYATAYDVKTKTCFTMDADKFHANCYSYSGAVCAMHYLLRQKPYRVMWGGGHVVLDDNLQYFSREEDLMGLSTYTDLKDFELNNEDLNEKPYVEKVKQIDAYSKEWADLTIYRKALKYFDYERTKSVRYSGYLVNHTKKIAVNLFSYWKKSIFYHGDDELACVDPVPMLTETGGGSQTLLFVGINMETAGSLSGTWCGDLLQIVDDLPPGYIQLIFSCGALLKRIESNHLLRTSVVGDF